MIRLDKFLCEMEVGTRSQVKEMVKKGQVSVNGEIIKKADYKFDETIARVCVKEKEISYQKFVNRSDVMGGGTLGSIASALLPVKTVDIGIPLLAMHSARELMATKDQQNMVDLVTAYFSI